MKQRQADYVKPRATKAGNAVRERQANNRLKLSVLNAAVTAEMIAAGNRVSEDMLNASICKSLGTIGGGMTLEDCMEGITEDRDIVEAYLANTVEAVTGIFLAMQRKA